MIFFKEKSALFPFLPTLQEQRFYGVTRDFRKLSMITKYVFRGILSSDVNFDNIRIMRTIIWFVKI